MTYERGGLGASKRKGGLGKKSGGKTRNIEKRKKVLRKPGKECDADQNKQKFTKTNYKRVRAIFFKKN